LAGGGVLAWLGFSMLRLSERNYKFRLGVRGYCRAVSRSLIQTLAAAAWSPDQPHAKRCQTDRVTPYCNQAIVFHRFRMLWMKQLFDLVQLMPQIGWLM